MKYLYKKFAKYYDLIYKDKNYEEEIKFIEKQLDKYDIEGGKILEVACGTGEHTKLLEDKGYEIVGFDLNEEMLEIAKEKVENTKLLKENMKDFVLDEKFDTVLCLFSSISYNKNEEELKRTLENFYNHLKDDGILIFDTSFFKENWKEGHTTLDKEQNEKVEIVRYSKSTSKNNIASLKMAYSLYEKDNDELSVGKEDHKLGLFKMNKIKEIAEKVGFNVEIYRDFNKGRYKSGRKPKHPIFVCKK